MCFGPFHTFCLTGRRRGTRSSKSTQEENSYAAQLNRLVEELGSVAPPTKYHDNEDRLAEYVIKHLKWPIRKEGNRWVGEDYNVILQQGGFHDLDERDLVLAAAGRIRAAMDRGQTHYDQMEESHRRILAAVLATILYHRTPPTNDRNR